MEALRLQLPPRVEHTFVFRLRRDHVVLLGFVESRHSLHGNVVGLCGSRCENYFLGIRGDEGCHLCPSLLHRGLRLPPVGVSPGVRVPVEGRQVRQHGVQDTRVQGRRG
uniref:Uncharacterized protein n=1 Tax=Lepeophtheirus salmonis TaxID=72036 RepID=A0A0K2TBX3_LEPSM